MDEIALADLEPFHLRPNLDDAHDGFVSGHNGFLAGDIMGHLRERGGVNAGGDFGFAGVAGKLFEQFQIGKAQAANFDLTERLMRARLEDRLGFVHAQLVRSDQLHSALFFRNARCRHAVLHLILAKIVSAVTHDARKHLPDEDLYTLSMNIPVQKQCRGFLLK